MSLLHRSKIQPNYSTTQIGFRPAASSASLVSSSSSVGGARRCASEGWQNGQMAPRLLLYSNAWTVALLNMHLLAWSRAAAEAIWLQNTQPWYVHAHLHVHADIYCSVMMTWFVAKSCSSDRSVDKMTDVSDELYLYIYIVWPFLFLLFQKWSKKEHKRQAKLSTSDFTKSLKVFFIN